MGNNAKITFIEKEGRKSQLANLKELLCFKFIIPLFQRPYAWNHDHFKDLLDSIKENKSEENREAFLGSIIVALKRDEDSDIPGNQNYLLIDGQQRITSFLMLLKCINNKLKHLIKEKDSDINEKHQLLTKAKQEKEVDLVEKYTKEEEREKLKKKEYEEYLKVTKEILIEKRIQRESDTEYKKSTELEQNILKHIFSDTDNSPNKEIKKIEDVFEEEIEEDVIGFLKYILDKCVFCFLAIKGIDSEDYAIDIFNSLNSTGEPLTAFEILKSLIHKKFKNYKSIQKELTEKFNNIEKELNRKKIKKIAQNKYTDRLLLFINMMTKGLQLEKTSSFRDKKKLLDKILLLNNTQIEECIKTMYSLHQFILNNWEDKKTPFKNKSLNPEDKIMFNFLQSINHDRVLPVLYYFRNSDLSRTIKTCVAFTCLWRGYSSDGSTDRIDNKYEKIIKSLFNKKNNIQELKNNILNLLREKDKKTLKKEDWVNRFKTIDIYNSRRLARFLLFIAFDKRDFNKETKILDRSKLRFLKTDEWNSREYRTIEHIVPQSYKSINTIGNLILLPQDINNKVGKKAFPTKKKIYEECLKTESNEMPYIPVLKEIVSYGKKEDLDNNNYLNENIINSRGAKLGNSIWQTLAEDWLEWKD